MKIAPNRTRRESARLVAYAVFQNKYICHMATKTKFKKLKQQNNKNINKTLT